MIFIRNWFLYFWLNHLLHIGSEYESFGLFWDSLLTRGRRGIKHVPLPSKHGLYIWKFIIYLVETHLHITYLLCLCMWSIISCDCFLLFSKLLKSLSQVSIWYCGYAWMIFDNCTWVLQVIKSVCIGFTLLSVHHSFISPSSHLSIHPYMCFGMRHSSFRKIIALIQYRFLYAWVILK